MKRQGHEIDKNYDLHNPPNSYYFAQGCGLAIFGIMVMLAIIGIVLTGGF